MAKKETIKKITTEELEKIKNQQQNLQKVLVDLGALEAKKFEVNKTYVKFLDELEVTKKELEEKYGQVNIDLTSGAYTKIEPESKK